VLSSQTVEAVRSVPITSILESEEIHFKKIGREAVTLCPWHNDSRPSLTINDEKGLCFCFACGGGSDGISYIQQRFNLSFSEAVERIAERHSIEIIDDQASAEEQRRRKAKIESLRAALSRRHERYRAALMGASGQAARDWILERGFTPEASRTFELGWNPSREDGDRVMIPVHDHAGRLVGFSGRVIDPGYSGKEKYKNSADSEIFNKSSIFFNEHRARLPARDSGLMIIVEGHLDVVSLWCAGFSNVVAIQGTAPPSESAFRRLFSSCQNFAICMDSDGAGRLAVTRLIGAMGPASCRGEINISVIGLPEGMDPGDCIEQGLDFGALVESARPWLDWQIDSWLAGLDRTDTRSFSQAEKAIRELVASIRSPALRQYYVDRTSAVLASSPQAAVSLARGWMSSLPPIVQASLWRRPDPQWIRLQAERRALRLYVHFPGLREELAPLMGFLGGAAHCWFWKRLQELESLNPAFGPGEAAAVLVVSEPRHTRVIRPLVQPTIELRSDRAAVDHIKRVLIELGGSLL
jgi:DNA primase